jgi:hypothetical protein
LEEFQHSRNQALALTAIQKQPFPLPHYCGICEFPSVALEAPIKNSLMGQGQNNSVDGAEAPS